MHSKLRFAARILRHRLQRQPCVCPYCGPAAHVRLLQRKKLLLNILQCDLCGLIFRWPMDSSDEADKYYDTEYTRAYPQVRLPERIELERLLQTNFAGSALDLSSKIRVLTSLRRACRVLDYGCSWGYGTFQLRQQGFEAVGFDISTPRAAFARERLGVQVYHHFEELASLPDGSFDVIFSNHVIEHLPKIRDTLDLTARLLSAGGLAFHILPNFTGTTAREGKWILWIGEEHPLAPTIDFFRRNLPLHGYARVVFASSPFDDRLSAALTSGSHDPISTDGDELLVLAYK